MSKKNKYYSSLLFCVLLSISVWGQTTSPYNRFGLGTLSNPASTSNRNLGGVSAAYVNAFNINTQNPATHADLSLTTFEIGLDAGQATIQSKDTFYKTGNSALSHITLGFPIMRGRWGAALSFKPYSNVSYAFNRNITSPQFGDYSEFYTGSGKLYTFTVGNGVRIKNFYIGAQLGLLFGKLSYSRNIIMDDVLSLNSRYSNTNSIRGFTYNIGALYKIRLQKPSAKKGNYIMTIGAYGSSSMKPVMKSNMHWERFVFATTGGTQPIDTIGEFKSEKGFTTLPGLLCAGITIQNGEKWLVSTDVKYTLWKSFKSSLEYTPLQNSIRWSIGLEYSPDKDASRKFFKYLSYRIGGYAGRTELIINGTSLNEAGITVGLGIPVRSKNVQYSMANVGFEFGTRGTNSNNLYNEKYYGFTLGIIFNDRWFIKRRFD